MGKALVTTKINEFSCKAKPLPILDFK